jgi:NAD(P)-dependent dehydrogenase (short-subunit alcohol dehydrogenase family)
VDGTPIKITVADTVIAARLADNATARDLAAELPLTLTFKDFNHVEKIAKLPQRLSTDGVPAGADMAFNNAGIQVPPTDAADEPVETFDRVNAINLRGIWACMKHELRQMRTQGSGAIVNCSSLGGSSDCPAAPPITPQSTE